MIFKNTHSRRLLKISKFLEKMIPLLTVRCGMDLVSNSISQFIKNKKVGGFLKATCFRASIWASWWTFKDNLTFNWTQITVRKFCTIEIYNIGNLLQNAWPVFQAVKRAAWLFSNKQRTRFFTLINKMTEFYFWNWSTKIIWMFLRCKI